MITARLKNESGKVLTEFNLPEHIGEMSLNQYVSFDTIASGEGNPVSIMAEAVQDFTGVNFQTIIAAQVGNIYEKTEALDDTLRSVYGYISRMIAGYKPRLRSETEHRFTYKGDEYTIPIIRATPLITGVVLPEISVIEAVEALELMRLSEVSVKERPNEAANIRFTTYLKMLAILARRDGEILPVNDAQREQFLSQRLAHFQDIDAQTALDVDFFLHSTLRNWNATHEIAGSFIRRLFALAVETQSWKGKPTTGRKRTTAKSSPVSAGAR